MSKDKPLAPVTAATSRSPLVYPNWLVAMASVALVALAGLLAYANTFSAPFVFDDLPSIVDNPVIKDWPGFIDGAGYRYNPRRFLGYLTLALNYRLGGLEVFGYHAFNLTIHLATSSLVYALAALTLKTPLLRQSFAARHGSKIALFAALLFVVHPVQTQAVTYIVQRMASLAAFFYLSSVVLYGAGRLMLEDQGPRSAAGSSGATVHRPPLTAVALLLFVGALFSALLAMKSKEIAFTLPLAILLYEFSFFRSPWVKRLWLLVPVAATALLGAWTLFGSGKPLGEMLSDVSRLTRETELISRHDYLLTQFRVMATYLRLLVLPVNQNLDYAYPVYTSFFAPAVFFSFLLLVALLAIAVYCYGFKFQVLSFKQFQAPGPELRVVGFGILWFFLTLSIESSVIPIADVIFEHRLYLPSVGMVVATAVLCSLLLRRVSLRIFWGGATLVVLMLLVATWQRNMVWSDVLTLWQDAAEKSPAKARVHHNLGKAFSENGRIDAAISQYRLALDLGGPDPDTLASLASELGKKGSQDEAVRAYRRALSLKPNHAISLTNLGVISFQQGDVEEGFRLFNQALKAEPKNPQVHFNLGLAYRTVDNYPKAVEHYRQAILLDPGYASAYNNLGSVYYVMDEHRQAVAQFRRAVELDPENENFMRNLDHALEVR